MAVLNKRAIVTVIEMYGVTAIRLGRTLNPSLDALIKALFTSGEQGFAYDPNDLTTMFQDVVGTIPVTTAGQPVGLMLDKSKGLVLGEELASVTEVVSLPIDAVGGVKTYLIGAVDIGKTYQISFTVSNFTGSGDVGIAGPTTQWSDGTSVFVSSNGTKTCIRTKLTTREVYLYTRNTAACVFSNISIKEIKGNHAYQSVSASRPVLRQTPILGNELVVNGDFSDGLTNVAPRNFVTTEIVTGALKVTNAGTFYGYAEMALPTEVGKTYLFRGDVIASSGTGAAFHIASVANSSDIATNVEGSAAAAGFMFTAKTTTTYLSLKTPSNATGSWRIFDNISVKEITGYRTDQNYLVFDGVDDFLQTNNIDFTATDKVSLFAGVRKLSDANAGALIELSTNASSTAGTFGINAPDGASSNDYLVRLRGIYDNFKRMTGNVAPVSSVVSARLDAQQLTVNNKINVRLNGITSAASGSGTPSTTQNFANQPLYIGRRGGATLPFNGHIYSLIGIGRLTTDAETIALEKLIAKNIGVTLSV